MITGVLTQNEKQAVRHASLGEGNLRCADGDEQRKALGKKLHPADGCQCHRQRRRDRRQLCAFFFVFDETGSTLASALVIDIQLVPRIFVPLLAAPLMDRLPRKAFLVGGDLCNGLIYAAMGVWLTVRAFSCIGYLVLSMILAMVASVDHLAFASIYPVSPVPWR